MSFADDPLLHDQFPVQRRKRTSTGCVIMVVVGVFLVLVTLCCGGGGAVVYFGLNLIEEEVEGDLRDNPVIAEHIGSIQSFEMDWGGSFVEEEDDDTFVFRIRGSKASGIITVVCDNTGSAEISEVLSGTLQVDSGETYDLFPEGP